MLKNRKKMRAFRWILMLIAGILIIGQLTVIDYQDISFGNNAGSYLGILAMFFLIVSMMLSNRYDKRKSE